MSNYTQSIGFTNSCARCREASVVAGMTIACRMHGGQSSEINEETVARLAKFGKEKKLYTQSEVDRLIREGKDEVLDELIEWYESILPTGATFNWYGAVKALKISKDYKKPFDQLSKQKGE